MTAPVPILRAQIGDTHVAVELSHVVSLLDPSQTEDLEVMVISAALGEAYKAPGAVALLTAGDTSIALGLDQVSGYEQWDHTRVARLPDWVAQHLPNILKPACGLGDDGVIVWIIHPPAFAANE